jgi:hypothetical protein
LSRYDAPHTIDHENPFCGVGGGKTIFALFKASQILAIGQVVAGISSDSADAFEKISVLRRLIIME